MNLSMKKPAPVDSLAVVVVEDDDETRESIERSIGHRPGLRLAGSYARGRDALAALLQSAPDVLLVTWACPTCPGSRSSASPHGHCPRCDVLVLTTFGDEEHVIAALEAVRAAISSRRRWSATSPSRSTSCAREARRCPRSSRGSY